MCFNKAVSPSRRYVAICNTTNFDGHYCKLFSLPEVLPEGIQNNTDHASWYFLNKVDFIACIQGVMTFEDYSNITQAKGY
jgi:hypothetical protein